MMKTDCRCVICDVHKIFGGADDNDDDDGFCTVSLYTAIPVFNYSKTSEKKQNKQK